MDNNVFNPPKQPRNSLELLKWLIFEPILLENYSETLDQEQSTIQLLQIYFWTTLILFIIYVISNIFIITFDLPSQYSKIFLKGFQVEWMKENDFLSKFCLNI